MYLSLSPISLLFPSLLCLKVIEEIVEMMENSPDPGENEEEDEEDLSTRTNSSLLEEIRQLSEASNNNCSFEG